MNARRSRSLLAAACVAVLLVTCASAPASAQEHVPVSASQSEDEASPVDPNPSSPPPKRRHEGLVIAGGVLLGISAGINVIGAGASAFLGGPKRENWLLVPGFGPLILMAETTNPVGNVLLALDALTQFGGIAMISYGRAAETAALARDGSTLSFVVTPLLGPGRAGIAIAARF